jgi:hypothetical protein
MSGATCDAALEQLAACNASLAALQNEYATCTCAAGLAESDSAGANPCVMDPSQTYGSTLHVVAIFVVLLASAVGAGFPLLCKHFPGVRLDPFYICLGKCIGTGVVISCALIHMLQPSSQSLTSPCVPWCVGVGGRVRANTTARCSPS